MLSRNNADFIGLADRGTLAPGMKADINVIELDRLSLGLAGASASAHAGGVPSGRPSACISTRKSHSFRTSACSVAEASL